ncbi:carboxypeptidase-like regulatory domain-containing protein [Dysgonomonas capnocytophagoides]|nr:carboxypeptidase-like regulatory domain-containing protein [Dysgonomonas capnocytophagoides]
MILCTSLYSQNNTNSGTVKNKSNNELLEFVSIGIVGKEIGTVSGIDGSYSLIISPEFDKDSIKFSCIGYLPFIQEVAKYKSLPNKDVFLEPKDIVLNEIVINQLNLKEKILGNKYKARTFQGGFRENNKGFECGVLLKINKKTHLQELVCNIAECTYDSIMYRVNIYKEVGNKDFTNILDQPIYIMQKIENKRTSLEIDLSKYNIMVEDNTLVTLEHIADMGDGHLLFSGSPFKGSTCYFRKKSHSEWNKTPLKLGFNVKVLEEI